MNNRSAGVVPVVAVFFFAAAFKISAQVSSSPLMVSGKVTDPQSNPVAELRVLLFDPQGAAAGDATTDKNGQFSFSFDRLGIYTLKVNAPGFEQLTQTIEVSVGTPAFADIRLGRLAEKQESITVTADVKDSQ